MNKIIITTVITALTIATVVIVFVAFNGRDDGILCTTEFSGNSEYMNSDVPLAAPLRGNFGCIDDSAAKNRDTNDDVDINIYGPLEAGFTSSVPGMSCLGSNTVPGGIDTHTAELMVHHMCDDDSITVLDYCGGHAIPYHYHEKMSCLYTADPATNHSTKIGTALDGNGIYGRYIDGGVEPTDLDACGGRKGVNPDSNGVEVYYYVITSTPPFTVGCFGPIDSVETCRSLYDTCQDGSEDVTTAYGTGSYDLDCPCYDAYGNNVGSGLPAYSPPTNTN